MPLCCLPGVYCRGTNTSPAFDHVAPLSVLFTTVVQAFWMSFGIRTRVPNTHTVLPSTSRFGSPSWNCGSSISSRGALQLLPSSREKLP